MTRTRGILLSLSLGGGALFGVATASSAAARGVDVSYADSPTIPVGRPLWLPVVDLTSATAPRDLRAAFHEFGGFRVREETLTSRITELQRVAGEFFEQPDDAKRNIGGSDYRPYDNVVPRGYSWPEKDSVGKKIYGKDAPPDLVEVFRYAEEDNVWPTGEMKVNWDRRGRRVASTPRLDGPWCWTRRAHL